MARVKFCGLTRAADAELAGGLGAAFVGVIFAGGPRRLAPTDAARVLDAAGANPGRVGVFGTQSADEVARVADMARLDVVQLHGDPTVESVAAVRERYGGRVWAVLRTSGTLVPPESAALFDAADAVLLDALVAGALGGTGRTLDWDGLRGGVDAVRGGADLVLAGGLTPENVGAAIAALAPAVVDVSSGVEESPGVKDHRRMRAFVEAVARAREFE